MTQFLCKKHGMQSAIFTSPNIQQKILKGEFVEHSGLKTLTLKLLSDVPGVYKVDEDFLEENQDFLSNITEESEFEIECRLVPVCASCYHEFLQGK
ncbi:hypothetical protein [Limnobacter sp.]|jgi:hypothetical protein|uniref:hypothetical protein n=1 Tax=Limnobacter sp. TaxID=2003368 RepID=UPI0025B8F83A|nr:hypothetical protein [Limnobacter sp.]